MYSGSGTVPKSVRCSRGDRCARRAPPKECDVTRAAIVATARTPIGRAYRGAFNNTSGVALAAHAVKSALAQVELDPNEVDDVIFGCALQQGTTGFNVARQAALRAGLPVSVPGATIDRQCS